MCLRSRFPRLFNLEDQKECFVREKMGYEERSVSWRWRWRRELRGREIGEFEELQQLLAVVTFNTGGADRWMWHHNLKGIFLVKQLS